MKNLRLYTLLVIISLQLLPSIFTAQNPTEINASFFGEEEQFVLSDLKEVRTKAHVRTTDLLLVGERTDSYVSTGWYTTDSVQYAYNADELLIMEVHRSHNGTNLNLSDSTIYTYTDNQDVLLKYTYLVIDGMGYEIDEQYEYDGNNNLLTMTKRSFENGVWIAYQQTNYTYDGNNNLTTRTYLEYNGTNLENVEQDLQEFDSDNNLTSRISQEWNGVEWENIGKSLYESDMDGNVIQYISQQWFNEEWNNYRKNDFEYTAQGVRSLRNIQKWDSDLEEWYNYLRYISAFDTEDNEIVRSFQVSYNDSLWADISRANYNYDANHNQIEAHYEEWNDSLWVNDSYYLFNYDIDNNLIYTNRKWWLNNAWTDSYRTYFYYSLAVGTEELENNLYGLKIFPNPSSGLINIDWNNEMGEVESIQLFNTIGQSVFEQKERSTGSLITIDLSGLPSGSYHLLLTTSDRTIQEKIQLVN